MLDEMAQVAEQKIREDLTFLFRRTIEKSMENLKLAMDEEIDQEIRQRIAVLVFDEMVNEIPIVPYLAVWEEGSAAIIHAYMSPKVKDLCGYSPAELARIGYGNIVRGDIIRFYREQDGKAENVKSLTDARQKRISGFLDSRSWEGCYRIEKRDGRTAWVIDRSTITRFRNTLNDKIICLSSGILLETTELLARKD